MPAGFKLIKNRQTLVCRFFYGNFRDNKNCHEVNFAFTSVNKKLRKKLKKALYYKEKRKGM